MNSKTTKFIGQFLSWYQDSFSTSDVVTRLKLEELVKEAESIHVEALREIEKQLQQTEKVYKSRVKKKRISRYL